MLSGTAGFLSSCFHCMPQRENARSAHDNCNYTSSSVRSVAFVCKRHAYVCINRIGICYRSEQECSCATNTAGCLSEGRKSLLREDHRLWHSIAIRTLLRDNVSDHSQPARDFRAPAGETIHPADRVIMTCEPNGMKRSGSLVGLNLRCTGDLPQPRPCHPSVSE